MIVNPKPTAENQDWDGDDADLRTGCASKRNRR